MFTTLFITFGIFALLLLILVTATFLLAQLRADNSLMDIAYGPIFLLAGLMSTWLLASHSFLTIIILGAITIWSSRLAYRIYRKNRGQKEDVRYANWRTEWSKRGRLYFVIRSYLQINLLQGVVILLVSLPLILSLAEPNLNMTDQPLLYLFLPLGLLVYITGLTIESLADHQLDKFIARKKAGTENAPIMTTGLFRYCRRPNYFGETLIWWGLALIVCPLPFGYLAFVSPLLITYIVTKVTGPMLEKIFMERYPKEYQAYQAKTNYFIPGLPKNLN